MVKDLCAKIVKLNAKIKVEELDNQDINRTDPHYFISLRENETNDQG